MFSRVISKHTIHLFTTVADNSGYGLKPPRCCGLSAEQLMHKCFSKQYQSCKWDHATESQAFTKKENVLISPISLLFISIYKLLQHYIYFSLCYNADVPQLILILTLAGWTKPPPGQFFLRNTGTVGGVQPGHMTWGTGHWCVALVYGTLSPQINARWGEEERMAGSHHCQPSRSPYRRERGRAACTEMQGTDQDFTDY